MIRAGALTIGRLLARDLAIATEATAPAPLTSSPAPLPPGNGPVTHGVITFLKRLRARVDSPSGPV